MADQKSSKGNPAQKRMSNAKRKATRQASWARSERRKADRRERQEKAHARNLKLIGQGQMTPWQRAKAEAKQRKEIAKS